MQHASNSRKCICASNLVRGYVNPEGTLRSAKRSTLIGGWLRSGNCIVAAPSDASLPLPPSQGDGKWRTYPLTWIPVRIRVRAMAGCTMWTATMSFSRSLVQAFRRVHGSDPQLLELDRHAVEVLCADERWRRDGMIAKYMGLVEGMVAVLIIAKECEAQMYLVILLPCAGAYRAGHYVISDSITTSY